MKDNGLEDGVMTVEEIRSGIESRGTGKLEVDTKLSHDFENYFCKFRNLLLKLYASEHCLGEHGI